MRESIATRDCGQFIGLSVGEVLVGLGLSSSTVIVFDEPPGVGRGLYCGGAGFRVDLWVSRQSGIFRDDYKWDVAEFLPLRVVGIVVTVTRSHQPTRREWWAGGGRFSTASQRDDVSPPTGDPA